MHDFLVANIAPLMFVSLILFLLWGYHVAFALAANGLLFCLIGIQLDLLHPQLMQALPERIIGIMRNDTLLAIPYFTFMGLILERSGMAEELLDTVGQLFGPVRGGLAYAVIAVGALLAATTGVVAASVISMGLISLPIMLRYGYDRKLATGVIAAAGTLAQIIPPSLVLIVMADQLGRPVNDLYEAAIVPGLLLTGFYALYVLVISLLKKDVAPALPPEARGLGERQDTRWAGHSRLWSSLFLMLLFALPPLIGACAYFELTNLVESIALFAIVTAILFLCSHKISNHFGKLFRRIVISLIPPLILIFLVLGTVFKGIATPTEGGAMGATGALILALLKRRLSFGLLSQSMESTARLSSFVIFILIGSTVFGLVFRGVNGHIWVEGLLTGLPGGVLGFLIVVNIMIFVLAFFLDFFELAFIIIPLLAPVAVTLGIDLVWFGVLLAVNMQTSFMHPPFGFALFYLRSVAPEKDYIDKISGKLIKGVRSGDIYRGSIVFVCIQVFMVILLMIFPALTGVRKVDDRNYNDVQLNFETPPALDEGYTLQPIGE